ncbi:MAG: high-affinity nickel-transport family protein [Candidatus Binataceae bacterium]|nr:high-affinity nickel-transport family protein [Candidatus Binataceae bacterium]
MGHTITVLAVGAAIIVFKLGIPVRLGLAMEFAVAVVLILLGAGAVTSLSQQAAARLFSQRAERIVGHSHPHPHTSAMHSHPHMHPPIDAAFTPAEPANTFYGESRMPKGFMPGFTARRPLLKSFAVGLVHGLAGSAAIALLVLGAIPNSSWATMYLAIFCVGVIFGMGIITTAIGAPFIFASRRISNLHQTLVMGSGLLSFCFGLFLAYQIGVIDQLFGIVPIWSPH